MPKDQYLDRAKTYQSIRTAPYTQYFEEPSVIQSLGNLEGLSVLDLACGTGHYTRIIKKRGAGYVVGVDLSESMIVEAKAHEQMCPFHITYIQGDARSLRLNECFDLVTAFYLLNYADTASDLSAMIETCTRHLKPSGRLVTIVPNPAFKPGLNDTEPYGFTLDRLEEQPQGQRVSMRFTGEDSFELEFMQWSLKMLEGLFLEQGLTQIQWRPFEVTPTGWKAMEEGFWTSALQNPKSLLLSSIRGS